jgi:hypothetical protein
MTRDESASTVATAMRPGDVSKSAMSAYSFAPGIQARQPAPAMRTHMHAPEPQSRFAAAERAVQQAHP